MLAEIAIDVVVASSGIGGLALMDSACPKRRKLAGVVGLVGQPFWLWTAFSGAHWGQLSVSLVVTCLYLKPIVGGIEAFFRRKPVQGER